MRHNTRFGVESKTEHLFAIRLASLVVTCDRISVDENGSFSMKTTLEVLTTRKSGREVHRYWPDVTKAVIDAFRRQ